MKCDCSTCRFAAEFTGTPCPPAKVNACQPAGEPWEYVHWEAREIAMDPCNTGPSADFARHIGDMIQKHISINPTITALCREGWIPTKDVPSDGRRK